MRAIGLGTLVTLPRGILFSWQTLQRGSVTRKHRIFITARLWLRRCRAVIFGTALEVGDVARARTAFDVTREACLRSHEARGRAFLNGPHTASPLDGEDR
jgi:hypothetical protein